MTNIHAVSPCLSIFEDANTQRRYVTCPRSWPPGKWGLEPSPAPEPQLCTVGLHSPHLDSKGLMSRISSCCCIFVQFSVLRSTPPHTHPTVFLSIPREAHLGDLILDSPSPMVMNILTAPHWTNVRVGTELLISALNCRICAWGKAWTVSMEQPHSGLCRSQEQEPGIKMKQIPLAHLSGCRPQGGLESACSVLTLRSLEWAGLSCRG